MRTQYKSKEKVPLKSVFDLLVWTKLKYLKMCHTSGTAVSWCMIQMKASGKHFFLVFGLIIVFLFKEGGIGFLEPYPGPNSAQIESALLDVWNSSGGSLGRMWLVLRQAATGTVTAGQGTSLLSCHNN